MQNIQLFCCVSNHLFKTFLMSDNSEDFSIGGNQFQRRKKNSDFSQRLFYCLCIFFICIEVSNYLNYLNLERLCQKKQKCRNHALASETDTPMILSIYDSRLSLYEFHSASIAGGRCKHIF